MYYTVQYSTVQYSSQLGMFWLLSHNFLIFRLTFERAFFSIFSIPLFSSLPAHTKFEHVQQGRRSEGTFPSSQPARLAPRGRLFSDAVQNEFGDPSPSSSFYDRTVHKTQISLGPRVFRTCIPS